jgi:hypothetical protein
MTDSVAVFPPGFRVTDQNGALVSGAQIAFYNAGTTTPRTVYSDSGLSTSLGSTVSCDAYGAPISGGGSNVLIYTGTTAYKVQLLTSGGTLIPGMSFDNVRGALDTSTYGGSATISFPVVAVSSTGTVSTLSRVENVNPTAGQITRTLPTAASAGNGAFYIARHDGTANAVLIVAQGSDLIHMRGDLAAQQTLQLYVKGDSVFLHCDGVDWHANHSPTPNRNRFWQIKAIQTAPPGSPVTGDSYLVTGTPTGAWSTFAADDILTYNGNAGWIRSRPSTDCGWLVYNAATGLYSRYIGSAWRTEVATSTTYGTVKLATSSDQQTSTGTDNAVTPSTQQQHRSAIKAWAKFVGSNGTITAGYNVSSVTRTGTGAYTVNFASNMNDTNYIPCAHAYTTGAGFVYGQITSTSATAASNVTLQYYNNIVSGTVDPTTCFITVWGN